MNVPEKVSFQAHHPPPAEDNVVPDKAYDKMGKEVFVRPVHTVPKGRYVEFECTGSV